MKRWGVDFLWTAGVPTDFKLHSARSAHASKSLHLGDSLDDAMNRCAWEKSPTFFTFYLRPLEENPAELIQQQIKVLSVQKNDSSVES